MPAWLAGPQVQMQWKEAGPQQRNHLEAHGEIACSSVVRHSCFADLQPPCVHDLVFFIAELSQVVAGVVHGNAGRLLKRWCRAMQVPILLWVAAVTIIFGVSYTSLRGLNGPLASLNTAAHVLSRVSRCRLYSCLLAYVSSTVSKFGCTERVQHVVTQLLFATTGDR